ncbi:haloacid dehalogenase-like hydrolase [Polynucleobacter nymphae]|uniref:haloacid dehalogenase-like hydrolase n=1 Tax=Polynucleobacter nymphae TaxID=2081043 RepID=UPI001C0E5770|nr:haloacid dehalogenase-like hydrolase [Polynucleobacter nymphae]MBU3607802.1 hypothetical protein [Polynucleobacter nymphae]
MRIGLDFDNTIACYDSAITKLAEEMFELPDLVPRTKLGVRDYLRMQDREVEWTAFQGELYGPGMRYAQAYEGAIETMLELNALGHELFIVSHRSKKPYAGHPHDLHAAARAWLKETVQSLGLFINDQIFFLETRDQKVQMIKELGCEIFLDDLPEVLEADQFPSTTRGILFAPDSFNENISTRHTTISQWTSLPALIKQA